MRKNEFIKTRLYFILAILLLTAVCIVVYTSMKNRKKSDDPSLNPAQEQATIAENETEKLQQASSTPHPDPSVPSPSSPKGEALAGQNTPAETTYYLAVTDGYLEVYAAQTGTLYMETAIAYDLLPERVQKEIDEGKYFESEEALLEFLENYSS